MIVIFEIKFEYKIIFIIVFYGGIKFFNLNLLLKIYLFICLRFKISFFLLWEFVVIERRLMIEGILLYLIIIFLFN